MKSWFIFLIFAIYSCLIFVKAQQSGMPSALHRLWKITFNFVNNISLILIVWFQIYYKTVYLSWVEKEQKVEDSW